MLTHKFGASDVILMEFERRELAGRRLPVRGVTRVIPTDAHSRRASR